MYGTAWKEHATAPLTELALRQGFRAIDTANQRKHYDEAAVGQGIAAACSAGVVSRDEIFIQTKFTFLPGQDHRLPYDPQASVGEQVQQSFASSLQHLQVSHIDSYVLHGPSQRIGLGPADRQAWTAMERLFDQERVGKLGVSNVSLEQLEQLCSIARTPPHIVQNRCFAQRGWDRDIRRFCAARGIAYQGFSLLTANRAVLSHPEVQKIAQRHAREVAQIVFRFAIDVGMIALTGTTDPTHMQLDLEVDQFQLQSDEVDAIELLLG